MNWTARVRSALARRGTPPDDGVVEELAQHAQAMYESARADGSAADEARRRVDVQIAMWAADAQVLKHRGVRAAAIEPPATAGASWSTGVMSDLRYAVRMVRRQPAFALLIVFTMAAGIGATSTLFSVTYGVLMKPLPWPGADRLVVVAETRGGRAPRFGTFSNAAYVAWRDDARTVDGVAAWSVRPATLAGTGEAERIRVTSASASLFPLLRMSPIAGSVYGEADEHARDGQVIVLSEGLWRQRFGADPAAIGRVVHLDSQAYRIVGVVGDVQAYPDRSTRAYVPLRVEPVTGGSLSMFNAIARLRPGVTAAQASAEATARGRLAPDTGMTTMAIFGGNGPVQIAAHPLADTVTSPVRRPLVVLLAAVALLLVAAIANLAGLQLARATTRRREVAIRSALGAGPARISRQLLVESLLLGLAGGACGLAMTALLHRSLDAVLPPDFPRLADVGMSSIVILFAAGLSLLTSVLLGVAPAMRARRVNLIESLTGEAGAASWSGSRSRVVQARLLIMTGQVAIACVLLVGASLLGRSFAAMLSVDRGYDPDGVVTARLALPAPAYTPERRVALVTSILDRLSGMGGAGAVAFTSELPVTPGGSTSAFTLPRPVRGISSAQASPRIVSANAFRALGMRIVAGRGFTDSDTEASAPVVVVNQAFARQYLDGDPVGATLPLGVGYMPEPVPGTVIGVVDDVRYLTAGDSSQPEVYYLYRQLGGRLPVPVVTLLVRSSGDPAAAAASLRLAVREADDHLVADAVMTMTERIMTTLARPRLYAVLLGAFAALSLAVAAVGLFGVLSYAVAQRSRELALRMALGASRLDIVRLVLGQGLRVTAGGVAAGVLGSIALTRTLGALLYGIERFDGVTYAAVPGLLLVMALVACLGPARRATRLDPLRLLK